jgi:hypothetical protein
MSKSSILQKAPYMMWNSAQLMDVRRKYKIASSTQRALIFPITRDMLLMWDFRAAPSVSHFATVSVREPKIKTHLIGKWTHAEHLVCITTAKPQHCSITPPVNSIHRSGLPHPHPIPHAPAETKSPASSADARWWWLLLWFPSAEPNHTEAFSVSAHTCAAEAVTLGDHFVNWVKIWQL